MSLRVWRDAQAKRRDVRPVEPARWAPVHVRARPSAPRGASSRRHVVETRRARRAGAAAHPVVAPAAWIGARSGGDAQHAGVDAPRLPVQREGVLALSLEATLDKLLAIELIRRSDFESRASFVQQQ